MKYLLCCLAALLLLLCSAAPGRADSCETYPGSQVYTDKDCNLPGRRPDAVPATQHSEPASGLRESLRKSLSQSPAGGNAGGSGSNAPPEQQIQQAEQIQQRILDARARMDAALANPDAPDAHGRFDAAMGDMRAAYADGGRAFPNLADIFAQNEQQDMQALAQRSAGVVWADATPPAPPKGPDNVTAAAGNVYVCDGAIAGRDASCREISPAGSCTGVILSDGVVGWHDSIETPCQPNDLAQRDAFLGANPSAAPTAAKFSMDAAGTTAEINRLTQSLLDEWRKAAEAQAAVPEIDTAQMARPINPSDYANEAPAQPDTTLDDALNVLNAASSILGAAAGGMSGYRAPSVPVMRAPTVSMPLPMYRPPATSGGSDITGTNR